MQLLYLFLQVHTSIHDERVILQPYKISVSSNRGECLVSQPFLSGLLFNQDVEACLSALGWRYDCAPPLPLLYPSSHYPSTQHEHRMRTILLKAVCPMQPSKSTLAALNVHKNQFSNSKLIFHQNTDKLQTEFDEKLQFSINCLKLLGRRYQILKIKRSSQ